MKSKSTKAKTETKLKAPAIEATIEPAAKTAESKKTTENPSLDRALEAARAALDKKADNLKLLELGDRSSFTDYFLLCNGSSNRQIQAIADAIESELKETGARPLSIEGVQEGRWVLMDYGDVVVHIFLDALRDYYNIESLWADAKRVKIPAEFYGPGASSQLLN